MHPRTVRGYLSPTTSSHRRKREKHPAADNFPFLSNRRKVEILEKQNKDLEYKLNQLHFEVKKVHIEKRRLIRERDLAQTSLKHRVAAHQSEKNRFLEDVQRHERSRHRQAHGALRQQIADLETQLRQQVESNYVLSLKLNVSNLDLTRLQTENAELKTSSSSSKKTETDLRRIFDETQTQLVQTRTRLETVEKNLSSTRGERDSLLREKTNFDSLLRKMREKVKVLERVAIRRERARWEKEKEVEWSRIGNELEMSRGRVVELERMRSEWVVERQDLRRQQRELCDVIDVYENASRSSIAGIPRRNGVGTKGASGTVVEPVPALDSTVRAMERLRGENLRLRERVSELVCQNESMGVSVKKSQRLNETLTTENAQLQSESQSVNYRNYVLTQKLRTADHLLELDTSLDGGGDPISSDASASGVGSPILSKTAVPDPDPDPDPAFELSLSQKKYSRLLTRVDSLETQLDTVRRERDDLDCQLRSSQTESREMQERCVELESEIRRLEYMIRVLRMNPRNREREEDENQRESIRKKKKKRNRTKKTRMREDDETETEAEFESETESEPESLLERGLSLNGVDIGERRQQYALLVRMAESKRDLESRNQLLEKKLKVVRKVNRSWKRRFDALVRRDDGQEDVS